MKTRLMMWVVLSSLLGALIGPSLSRAASFNVNNTADTVDKSPGDGTCADAAGNCTLRAAIMEANALGGNNTITLPEGTFKLTIAGKQENGAATGDLDITVGTLTITGAAFDKTLIDANQLDRAFDLFSDTNVTISKVTILNGQGDAADSSTSSQTDGGGCIRAYESNLTLDNMEIDYCRSDSFGGAIAFQVAPFARPKPTTLKINFTSIQYNWAEANGGGIAIGMGARLELVGGSLVYSNTARAKIIQNNARHGGGGIYIAQGYTPIGGDYRPTNVLIDNASVEENNTTNKQNGLIDGAAWGGGILMESSEVTINNSRFNGNWAEGRYGGGIYNDGGNININNSSFNGNLVLNHGGAIYSPAVANGVIQNSRFTNNRTVEADNQNTGGALVVSGQAGQGVSFVISNIICQDNRTDGSGGCMQIGDHTEVVSVTLRQNMAGGNGGAIAVRTGNTNMTIPSRVTRALIENNTADIHGGGIVNGGILLLSDSVIQNNTATLGQGGGIANFGFALMVTNTVIAQNKATQNGGGVYDEHSMSAFNNNYPRTPMLTRVSIDSNEAGGDGGGIYSFQTMKVVDSSITNNKAKVSGGGILTYSAFQFSSDRRAYPTNLELVNVTLSGNQATGTQGDGGGLYQNGGISLLNNVTIANNTAARQGGGIFYSTEFPAINDINPNMITVTNSIIAQNTASGGGTDCQNTLLSGGSNLLGNNTNCTFTAQNGDKVGAGSSPIDPLLGALAQNEAGTYSHPLMANSPAIDAGNAASCAKNDQRGAARQGTCDMGAYELGGQVATPTPTATATSQPTATPKPGTPTPNASSKRIYLPLIIRK